MISDVGGVHTVTSVVHPKGATNMPFDEITAYAGGAIVQLEDPGLLHLQLLVIGRIIL
jgi:hypothetical protein